MKKIFVSITIIVFLLIPNLVKAEHISVAELTTTGLVGTHRMYSDNTFVSLTPSQFNMGGKVYNRISYTNYNQIAKSWSYFYVLNLADYSYDYLNFVVLSSYFSVSAVNVSNANCSISSALPLTYDNLDFRAYTVSCNGVRHNRALAFTFFGEPVWGTGSNLTTSFFIPQVVNAGTYLTDDIGGIITESNEIANEQLEQIKEQNEKLDDLKDSITSDDTSGADSQASDFFSSFESNDFGLTGIITAPLNLISNIVSSNCSPLSLPLPFVNKDLVLPCLMPIYQNHFGGFLTLYQTITFGLISYYVIVNILAMVKGFKDPDNDEIQVVEL